jgi:Pentapeptide repeats (8 copies)
VDTRPRLTESESKGPKVTIIEGFKFVRKDGTTHNGYQWPLPTHGKRVRVKADPCPQFEGDGLCVALTAQAASSGGVRASEAVGLWLEYKPSDILAEGDGKCRVKAVTVTGVFDVTAWVRTMCAGAYLSGANLSGANLSGADLFGADLSGAYGRDDWDALVARGAIR